MDSLAVRTQGACGVITAGRMRDTRSACKAREAREACNLGHKTLATSCYSPIVTSLNLPIMEEKT
jgi:hypothetical protein